LASASLVPPILKHTTNTNARPPRPHHWHPHPHLAILHHIPSPFPPTSFEGSPEQCDSILLPPSATPILASHLCVCRRPLDHCTCTPRQEGRNFYWKSHARPSHRSPPSPVSPSPPNIFPGATTRSHSPSPVQVSVLITRITASSRHGSEQLARKKILLEIARMKLSYPPPLAHQHSIQDIPIPSMTPASWRASTIRT
jgi:hypothetical protein